MAAAGEESQSSAGGASAGAGLVNPVLLALRGGDARLPLAEEARTEETQSVKEYGGSQFWPRYKLRVEHSVQRAMTDIFNEPLVEDWFSPHMDRRAYNLQRPLTLFLAPTFISLSFFRKRFFVLEETVYACLACQALDDGAKMYVGGLRAAMDKGMLEANDIRVFSTCAEEQLATRRPSKGTYSV